MPFRTYGMICPECKKSVLLGDVLLPLSSNLADLHNVLVKEDWKAEFRVCPTPRCKALMYTTVERLIFLDSPAPPQTLKNLVGPAWWTVD